MKLPFKKQSYFIQQINKLQYNRILLYIILFVSIINMTSNALMGDLKTPLIFILIGIIVSYFNKNMVIILSVSLIFSNILKYGTKIMIDEGFANEDTTGGDIKNDNSSPLEKQPESEEPVKNKESDISSKNKISSKMAENKEFIKDTMESYENLFSIQNQIMKTMESLTDDLSNAEKIIERLETNIAKKK